PYTTLFRSHTTPTVRPHARRVPADPREAGAHGNGPHRRPPPHLPRGLGEGPRRGAGDPRGGDGQSVRDGGGPADRGRCRADPGGRGVLASHPVDRLYRAVRALRIYEGTTEIQHLIVAGPLL